MTHTPPTMLDMIISIVIVVVIFVFLLIVSDLYKTHIAQPLQQLNQIQHSLDSLKADQKKMHDKVSVIYSYFELAGNDNLNNKDK